MRQLLDSLGLRIESILDQGDFNFLEPDKVHGYPLGELSLARLGYDLDDEDWSNASTLPKPNFHDEFFKRVLSRESADCKIVIDEHEIPCHILVLRMYSGKFARCQSFQMMRIPSKDCDALTFELIYEWMTHADPDYIILTATNVLDIYKASQFLEIGFLEDECYAFMEDTTLFNEDTAVLLYLQAHKKKVENVKKLMLPRVQKFFLVLVSSEEWVKMDLECVEDFLNSDDVRTTQELDIFFSALRWIKYDKLGRWQHVSRLFKCVRFDNFDARDIVAIGKDKSNPNYIEEVAKVPEIFEMMSQALVHVITRMHHEDKTQPNPLRHLTYPTPRPRNWIVFQKSCKRYSQFLEYLNAYSMEYSLIVKGWGQLVSDEDRAFTTETLFELLKLKDSE